MWNCRPRKVLLIERKNYFEENLYKLYKCLATIFYNYTTAYLCCKLWAYDHANFWNYDYESVKHALWKSPHYDYVFNCGHADVFPNTIFISEIREKKNLSGIIVRYVCVCISDWSVWRISGKFPYLCLDCTSSFVYVLVYRKSWRRSDCLQLPWWITSEWIARCFERFMWICWVFVFFFASKDFSWFSIKLWCYCDHVYIFDILFSVDLVCYFYFSRDQG